MKIFKLADLYVNKRSKMNKNNGYMNNIMNGFLNGDRIHLYHLGYQLLTAGLYWFDWPKVTTNAGKISKPHEDTAYITTRIAL